MRRVSIWQNKELVLGFVIAMATLLGGVLSSLFNTFIIDANTERETDVQLVELAINILSTPYETAEPSLSEQGSSQPDPSQALREWAVDTINRSAEVQFDDEARYLLVNGEASLPRWGSLGYFSDKLFGDEPIPQPVPPQLESEPPHP